MPNNATHNDYDQEPVFYCTRCYSMKIQYEEAIDSDCCMDCGCSDIAETSIENWERMYERRYGSKYVNRNEDVRCSFIFKLTLQELKTRLFNHPKFDEIIHNLYPRFPKGYGKADSILLLFDKLDKDRRMDDLRLQLLKYS